MKFDKFVKSVGSKGIILNDVESGRKYLKKDNVMMVIDCDCVGSTSITPHQLNPDNYTEVEATLVRAELPTADAKAKDIIRVFKDLDDCEIGIGNAEFSLIESYDRTFIMKDECNNVVGLSVYEHHAEYDKFLGVIFDKDWLNSITIK
jgi:hypothetical protein